MTGLVQLGLQAEDPTLTDIPLGEWLPDLPDLNNPGALEALNVVPASGAYVPFKRLKAAGGGLPDTVQGAAAAILANDTVQLYAATNSRLYTKLGGAFRTAFVHDITAEVPWKFLRINDVMVAVHPSRTPLKHVIGTQGDFTLVGGNPPRAQAAGQVGDFLMLGNLLTDPDDPSTPVNGYPSRVRWSAFNNLDLPWVTSLPQQSDFQDMPTEGGAVVAITGRDYGTIFQQRMISRATYRGPPAIFDIVTLEDKRGAIARDCVIDVGAAQFFIAEDGFFVWNGTNSSPIGDNKINSWFFRRLNYGSRARIAGAWDPVNGCVMWAFPTDASGALNEIIIYSYREDRFTHAEYPVEYIFNSAASTVVLEDLDNPLESYTETFDSPNYRSGGRAQLGGFDTNHVYGLFNGPALPATLDTGEYSGPDGRRIFVNNARPIVDTAEPVIQMEVLQRDQLIGGPQDIIGRTLQEDDGTVPMLVEGRYLRFRTHIPEGTLWFSMTGVQVARKSGGKF